MVLRGIVDSGATCSYLIVPHEFEVPFAIKALASPPRVQLADGSTVVISKSASLSFEVLDLTSGGWFGEKNHDFRFLRLGLSASGGTKAPSSRSYPYCLIGRDLIGALGLVCHGIERAYISEHLVHDVSRSTTTSPPSPAPDATEVIVDCDTAYVADSTPSAVDDQLLIRLPTTAESSLLKVLNEAVIAGWKPIPLSPGYKTRIRKLSNNDSRDVFMQQFVAELYLPSLKLQQVQTRDYAKAMYSKLPDDLKEQYKIAVEDYVSKGLWQKPSQELSQSYDFRRLPFSSTFMVHGGSRRPRLVIDLRSTNALLPKTTASMAKLWEATTSLRVLSPNTIAVADIKSAFYSIRISSESKLLYFKIRTAVGDFITTRVGFGCSPGPGSLINTLGDLVERYRSGLVSLPGWVIDFIDDLIIAGFACAVVNNLAQLLWLLQLVAFCAQQKKLGIICAPSQADTVVKLLDECNINLPVAESISIFNASFRYETSHSDKAPPVVLLAVDCRRTERMEKAISYLNGGRAISLRLTKKAYFCLAGVISFDCSRLHGEMRLLGDVIRAFIGSRFASTPWDKECDLSSLNPRDQSCFTEVVNWGLELCKAESSPCHHTSTVYEAGDESSRVSLVASCDASLYGGGIVISRDCPGSGKPPEIILSDCLRFSRTQANYSANRRELLVCLQTLRILSSLVEYLRSVATSQSRDLAIAITLQCDNRSSISWINDPTAVVRLKTSKALEKRSIIRLVECIAQEISCIRCSGATITVSHVRGSSNVLADAASRCLDRIVPKSGNQSLGALLLSRGEGEGIKINEIYNSVRENTVEVVGRDSDDPTDCCFALTDPCLTSSECDLCALLQGTQNARIRCHAAHHPDCCRVLEDISIDRATPSSSFIARNIMDDIAGTADVLDTINCVFELRDDLQVAASVQTQSEPIVEVISAYSYDLDDILWRVELLRKILRVLKDNKERPDARRLNVLLTDHWGHANIRAACRSAQRQMLASPVKSTIGNNSAQHGGPVHFSVDAELADVFVHRSGLSDGSVILLPIVPREATMFGRKIVLDAHRENAHPGVPGTVGFIRDFYLPAVIGLAKSVVSSCICCRISNASRGWHTPPGTADVDSMARYGPYHCVTIDVVSLGEKTHALSCQCRFTRHVTWQHIPDETTSSILDALCRAQVRAGPFRIILCDRASYFRSTIFIDEVARRLGSEVRLLSRHAPWEGGHERHHGVMCALLRNSLRHSGGRLLSLTPQQRQDLFDRICLVHNNLPLGSYLWLSGDKLPVCPELLCNGRLRSLNRTTMMFCDNVLPYRAAQAAQRTFLSEGWALIKRRNSAVRPITRVAHDAFDPGRTVLVYSPAPRKLAKNFTIAHVHQKISRNRVEVILPTGVKTVENMYNVLPIGRHPEDYPARTCGPSLVGMPIRVWISDTNGAGRWYSGFITDQSSDFEVLVSWSNGDPEEWLNLATERWQPSTDDGVGTPPGGRVESDDDD
ncbi:hypothetical protein Pmar_PMAR007924 [Perkinsus marinus ATCC 50983]|uniref:Uncharacterized protein n=1 Tax=Perkinsus marinus (strain ATCC 50983 / TXsc) TaxID=423536 RepID=C5L4R2_PERM5|nr:hypothetical protein Pmar_PMAR007924 [Perkinsus marinus ATCC 50983]EER08253.1 hypothetical protein Pmar_PMAR007924 [Perkinsus marinus ATCC 50983]|eukprot:XP_002776437.1 hypothetical protein Pmar_PMAR007924 [Perkinsus marinus ATCC 50983]